VVEKSTGEFSIGAGYSTGGDTPGASVQGSVTERNFLGRGQYIRLSAGGGKDSRDYMVSFTEPYFLGRRIAAGFDVYKSTREYRKYDSEVTGATVRFGLPITQNISTQLAYNYSQEKYKFTDRCDSNGNGIADGPDDPEHPLPSGNVCDVSQAIQDAVDQGTWAKSSVSANLVYNTIDDMKSPHYGIYANFGTEVAGLGGDAKFVKFTARGSVYHTLSEEMDIVALVTAGAGHIQSYGDKDLRVFDHFKSNDRIIRGFDYNGIGPYDASGKDHLGGTTYFHATAETQFPLPIIPESFGLRGAVFADAATLYGNKTGYATDSTDSKLRASVGVGLMWASPFGPLRIDYAVPVAKESTDKVQEFNFGMSTRF
jgi:outer membrane protein insertion porin family